jgi:hypothetical protein
MTDVHFICSFISVVSYVVLGTLIDIFIDLNSLHNRWLLRIRVHLVCPLNLFMWPIRVLPNGTAILLHISLIFTFT